MNHWLKTLRQFLSLIMGVTLFLGVSHSCVRWLGQNQQFQRIDHPVIKKINNTIYLYDINDKFVINLGDQNKIPEEIQKMIFLQINSLADKKAIFSQKLNSECVFMQFNLSEQTQPELDEIIDFLGPKTCVFVNTPHLKVKSYIAFKKPRWFFNLMEVDLQKSRFLASLALETLASLKGDFIFIDPMTSKIPPRLMSEIQRRDIIIFELKQGSKNP